MGGGERLKKKKNEAGERKFYSLPEVSLRLPLASAASLPGFFFSLLSGEA